MKLTIDIPWKEVPFEFTPESCFYMSFTYDDKWIRLCDLIRSSFHSIKIRHLGKTILVSDSFHHDSIEYTLNYADLGNTDKYKRVTSNPVHKSKSSIEFNSMSMYFIEDLEGVIDVMESVGHTADKIRVFTGVKSKCLSNHTIPEYEYERADTLKKREIDQARSILSRVNSHRKSRMVLTDHVSYNKLAQLGIIDSMV